MSRGNREMQTARLYYHRVQFSINRIADMYYNLKVKKVGASMLLQS